MKHVVAPVGGSISWVKSGHEACKPKAVERDLAAFEGVGYPVRTYLVFFALSRFRGLLFSECVFQSTNGPIFSQSTNFSRKPLRCSSPTQAKHTPPSYNHTWKGLPTTF